MRAMIRHILFLIILVPNLATRAKLAKNLKYPQWNETWVERLRKDLLFKYDKFARPAQHYNATTLLVYLNIMHVELDSKKSIMSVNTWVRMTWGDEKLKWNSQDYGGIQELSLGIHEVWQPDLYLYNSALNGIDNYESRHCLVRYDGEVTWIAPTVFHSACQLNFLLWPFETNTCMLYLGSWTYNGDEINMNLQHEGFDLQYYSAGEWKIQNISAERSVVVYDSEPYITVNYEIKLTRSSELYYHVIFVASIPIVFLVLVTFWLKPQSEMKLILNISAVVIDVLFLLYFGYKVPARNNNLPLIVRFFSGCLCQMTISIIISSIVVHISTHTYDAPVPRSIKRLLFGKIGTYLGLYGAIREVELQKVAELQELQNTSQYNGINNSDLSISELDNGDEDQLCVIPQSQNIKHLEWVLLATAIDRIAFILFCTIFTITAIAYIRVNSDAFSKSINILNLPPSSISNNLTSNDYF